MTKKQTVKEKMHDLIFHMLENGWSANHDYLERFNKGDVDFEALILGTENGRNHLVAEVNEETFVVKFENKRLKLWRMKPSWKKIGNWPVGKIELIENGFRYVKETGIVREETNVIVNS